MPTKVYLSGKNIIVDQTGQDLLTIRTDRALYTTLTPFNSVDGKSPVSEYIEFKDVYYLTVRTELITGIQDSTGASFADYFALKTYLDGFFQRSAGKTVYIDNGATSQYQEILILQNEALQATLDNISEDSEELNKIKELIKTNNKVLSKIYNPE